MGWEWNILVTEGWRLVGGGLREAWDTILLPMRRAWDGDGSEVGDRDRLPGWEREVPGTARAAFSRPALQGTVGSQARTSEAKKRVTTK